MKKFAMMTLAAGLMSGAAYGQTAPTPSQWDPHAVTPGSPVTAAHPFQVMSASGATCENGATPLTTAWGGGTSVFSGMGTSAPNNLPSVFRVSSNTTVATLGIALNTSLVAMHPSADPSVPCAVIRFVAPVDGGQNGAAFDTVMLEGSVKWIKPLDPNVPVLKCTKNGSNVTTLDLSTGQPGWALQLPGNTPGALAPMPNMVPSPWSAVPGAQWVGPQGATQAAGAYVYETKVSVLQCANNRPAKLKAQFRADNVGKLELIDPSGNVVTAMNQAGTPNYGFLPASLSPASAPGLYTWNVPATGVYTVRMTVHNSAGPTGVAANVILSR